MVKNKVKVTVYDQDKHELSKEVLQINRLIQVQSVSPNQDYYVNIKIKLGNYVVDRDYLFSAGVYRQSVTIERRVVSDETKGSVFGTVLMMAVIVMGLNYQKTKKYVDKVFRH